ncbi:MULTISPECIES: hypothetical protein [unclassified Anoxybacillus]|uniref:hypothetical protein n=1 Tax=unclassified Anoxybacillus TaxID=2639704 RepID=UPI0018D23352|nr:MULTISPECIES: hypothetical protein [unclassified Anoxybacillus]
MMKGKPVKDSEQKAYLGGKRNMSLPNIPNITPIISLERCETIDLLLSSIALEEIGLSNILNAEAEKLQAFLNTDPNNLNDYLKINESINRTLRAVVKSQILLQFRLEDIILLDRDTCCEKCPSQDPDECDEEPPCPDCLDRYYPCGCDDGCNEK